MKLIQAKLRGTGPLLKSGWFQLSSGLNQFHFSNPVEGTHFLRALQTLHPLTSCSTTLPFQDLPHFEERGGYTRHIQPSKRTIALGVFAATAEIVGELGELDQNLYETDRIEIGRRFDYSRWMNFVELSSSNRWKDVGEQFKELLEFRPQLNQQIALDALDFTNSLKGSDRVKGEIAEKLVLFLQNLDESCKNLDLYHETLELIHRADHFQTAREILFRRLPLLIYFNSQGSIDSPVSTQLPSELNQHHNELYQYMEREGIETPKANGNTILARIKSGVELAISTSVIASRMPPIFLFDAPEISAPQADYNPLKDYIISIAKDYQCFYHCHNGDFFSPDQARKNYTSEDLKKLLTSTQRADRRNK